MDKVASTTAGVEAGWRTAGRFLLSSVILQLLYACGEGSAAETLLVESATVASAAWFISLLDPHIAVLAVGREIIAPCGTLSILNGCDGSETLLLLAAAIIAAPVSRGWRLLGLLASLPFVYVINQIRLVALFFSYCFARNNFAFLHGYAAPSVIVVLCSLFFLAWLQLSQIRTLAR
jgi:exosortase family protein XrtM